MQNILITTSSFGTYDSSVIETMESAGFNLVFNPYGRKLTEAEIKDLVMQHSPVGILAGVEPLTRDVFSVAEGLKTIARCGIGMDSVDQTAAADMGISVTNTPDGPTRAVAELVLGAVLSLLRGMHTSDTSIRAGKWVRPFGELLHGKRVGLLGCGRIGSMAAGLFRAFGCEVFGSDPVNVLEDGIMLAPNELVRRCDIVSLHLPYTKQNHHIMDRAMVESMKRGSVVVNTSRGGFWTRQQCMKPLYPVTWVVQSSTRLKRSLTMVLWPDWITFC